MFITKRKHERIVADLTAAADTYLALGQSREKAFARVCQERDEALAELAAHRARKERALANLTAANAKRKAEAAERKGVGNG